MTQSNLPQDSLSVAQEMDKNDPLAGYRNEFVWPQTADGQQALYFAGHSLGLMPKKAKEYIDAELSAWGKYGVEAHFRGKYPWLPYHENLTPSFARLVGARETEVVAMNSLTVNLHLLLISFYKPTKNRFKILIENNAFPSDKYAVDSQVTLHGYNPSEAVVELKPDHGLITSTDSLLNQIESLGESLAIVLLGNCNYLSGQRYPFVDIAHAAHKVGAYIGFNLAHGAGNIELKLHDWDVDFSCWCSYKYLNSGPGGVAGAYVHEKHHKNKTLPRLNGWWGQNKSTRFKMGPDFDPIPTIEAWQLSNPPIFQLASLRASMELFDRATMNAICKKSELLTDLLESEIKKHLASAFDIVTPPKPDRGSMLCLKFKKQKKWNDILKHENVFVDFREPDIIRITPAPLYNSFTDVYKLVQKLKTIFYE